MTVNMKIFFRLSLIVFIASFIIPSENVFAAPSQDCAEIYKETGECPTEICQINCLWQEGVKACVNSCESLECYEITAQSCPLDRCQILVGCKGEKICFGFADD